MNDEKIKRINELYHKAKNEGLTEDEKLEQKKLREEYVADFKRNLRSQLNNISVVEKDGTVTDLGEKYGNNNIH